ncbi:MAG: HD-GYP domain-containing protein [Leptospiraceae bacterium]|nr:HD-GYP domain-containing protein [Leptospiraceae bacterium]MCP5511795.1 HD-GYP domain-containing protein [Leptospiraceae bacterium]
MKSLKVSDLVVGGRYSKPIYLDQESIFINANITITESDVQKLKKFGLTEVFTDGVLLGKDESIVDEPPSNPSQNKLYQLYKQTVKFKTDFQRTYNDVFLFVQNMYRKTSEDKSIEVAEIRSTAELILDHVKSNPNFLFFLLNHFEEGYYLYNQTVKSTFYAVSIGTILEYSRPKLLDLCMAGLVADIGMAKIPSTVSEKNGTLNEEEYKVIKKHPLIGYQILTKNIKLKGSLANIALQHHENYDGSGYPQRLKKSDVDEASYIYSIADNFSSMTSNRPWRRKFLPYDALKTMISVVMNKFDLKILRLFLSRISMYPIGSYVELSDGSIGQVLDSNQTQMLRPSLFIVRAHDGKIPKKNQFINLVDDTQIYITKAVDFVPFDED